MRGVAVSVGRVALLVFLVDCGAIASISSATFTVMVAMLLLLGVRSIPIGLVLSSVLISGALSASTFLFASLIAPSTTRSTRRIPTISENNKNPPH